MTLKHVFEFVLHLLFKFTLFYLFKLEIKVLEKKYKDGSQRFEPRAYGVDKTAKKIAVHIDENKDSLNRDIDQLISKYHMNPNG